MEWTFEDFEADLKDLTPQVRNKALEIANQLMKEEGYSKAKAIKEAITKAQEWFFDSEA